MIDWHRLIGKGQTQGAKPIRNDQCPTERICLDAKPPQGRTKGVAGVMRLGSSLVHSSCHQQHRSWGRRGRFQRWLWSLQQLQLQTCGGGRQNQRQLWKRVQGPPYQVLGQLLCNQKEGLQMKGRTCRCTHLLSSQGPLPKSGGAAPVTTLSVPSPLAVVLSWVTLLCRKSSQGCAQRPPPGPPFTGSLPQVQR